MPALVIEDDVQIARIFELALTNNGLDVEMIHDGQQAQDRLAEVVPDIVVLDLNLPSVSGVELLHAIRADDRLSNVTVFVVSANPQMSSGIYDIADLVLIKPVSYRQLSALVERFLSQHFNGRSQDPVV